jgi:hypothetical protein
LFFWMLFIHSASRWLLTGFACVMLAACASVSAPIVGVGADVYSEFTGNATRTVIPAQLNPAYRYLKVDVKDHPSALLVLGYLEPSPQGDVEVWYSAEREVLKVQNGRLVGTAGLEVDWRHVGYVQQPANWAWVFQSPAVLLHYERVRDVMPGYRMGIHEQMQASVATPPAYVLPQFMPANAIWVQEQVSGIDPSVLPAAWFAVASVNGQAAVVASYQCLSVSVCLRLQPWPVVTTMPATTTP